MIAKNVESGLGYIITSKGKGFGKVFLTESGKITTKSEKAAWFSNKSSAMQVCIMRPKWTPIAW